MSINEYLNLGKSSPIEPNNHGARLKNFIEQHAKDFYGDAEFIMFEKPNSSEEYKNKLLSFSKGVLDYNDQNKNGTLDKEEYRKALLGSRYDSGHLPAMFDKDLSSSVKGRFGAFSYFDEKNDNISVEELALAFKELDQDGDGRFTIGDLNDFIYHFDHDGNKRREDFYNQLQ